MEIKNAIYEGKVLDYKVSDTGIMYGKNGKVMKDRFTPNGYMQLCARIDNEYVYIYLHRLIYETFKGPIAPGMDINHIDGDKTNNSVDNLEMVTRQYNITHSWKNSLAYVHNPHMCHHLEKRFEKERSIDVIHEICKELELPNLRYRDIANEFEVPISIIYGIARGYLWKDISSQYDISGRIEKRLKMYEERDEKIKSLRKEGYKAKEIAEKLDMTSDAVYRRMYLMRKSGKLED